MEHRVVLSDVGMDLLEASEKIECSCYGTVLNFTQLHALYAGLKHFAFYVDIIFFTEFYAILRGANIHYEALSNLRVFTQLNALYAS
jgi:hypothetical protein